MGAWAILYRRGLQAGEDYHLGRAILALKRELTYNGHDLGMNLNTTVFGKEADLSTRSFQNKSGIGVDGIIGPVTARHLFFRRSMQVEGNNGIPDNLLGKIKTLESTNDPNAIGFVDPNDHGLLQVNMPSHPALTLEQVLDPGFILPWGAQHLRASYVSLTDWDAAVASWNIGGYYAKKWLTAGKPNSGLIVNGKDIFSVADQYVRLVKSQLA